MNRLCLAVALVAFPLVMSMGYRKSEREWQSEPATAVAVVLLIVLPLIGAGLLARGHYDRRRHRGEHTSRLRHPMIESELLNRAAAKGGRLTTVELAMHLAISPESATEALDRLALRGQAEYEVTDAGVIVYSFHDIIHLGGKHSAKGVLDA